MSNMFDRQCQNRMQVTSFIRLPRFFTNTRSFENSDEMLLVFFFLFRDLSRRSVTSGFWQYLICGGDQAATSPDEIDFLGIMSSTCTTQHTCVCLEQAINLFSVLLNSALTRIGTKRHNPQLPGRSHRHQITNGPQENKTQPTFQGAGGADSSYSEKSFRLDYSIKLSVDTEKKIRDECRKIHFECARHHMLPALPLLHMRGSSRVM